MKKSNLLEALMGMIGMTPEAHLLATTEFEAVPVTEAAYMRMMEQLTTIDPADVFAFNINILHRDPEAESKPCKGCGEIHEAPMVITGGLVGDAMIQKAMILRMMDQAGLD